MRKLIFALFLVFIIWTAASFGAAVVTALWEWYVGLWR